MSDDRDLVHEDPDRIGGPSETLQGAPTPQLGRYPTVSGQDLYRAVVRQPGPTEIQVSRAPGSSLAPGIEVAGARHRPAARGQEQFETIGGAATTGLVRNLLSTSRYQAAVHVQPGAGPDDPPAVVHPHADQGEIPPAMRDVLSYDVRPGVVTKDGRHAGDSVVENV